MKATNVLAFVALATAFVLPDVETFRQLSIHGSDRADEEAWANEPHVPGEPTGLSAESIIESLSSGVGRGNHAVGSSELGDHFDQAIIEGEMEDEIQTDRPHGRHGHHASNLTIYQLISKSNYTTKFAKLVDKFDSIVQLLNSTKANYTLFVPVDSAFEHIPHHGDKKPNEEFLEKVLKYHIGLGLYAGHGIITTQTVPTALKEELLGGEPQRLRTSVGLSGLRVNFYSRVVASNIGAKNGVIHAVNHILVPPPFIGREFSLFPSHFSTLLLAYEKTDFVSFIHGLKLYGSTVFAPTNAAFRRLGPRANAFLFNTEKGRVYLRALLKYQIVANATLYSDAFYKNGGDGKVDASERYHVDLTTLLHDKPIAVDVTRWGVFAKIVVNKYVPVVVRDGIAKNGVIQVVGRVPIPPHEHHKEGRKDEPEDGEIDVEDLKSRLEGYVDDGGSQYEWMSDL